MNISDVLLYFWDYSIILPAAIACILPVMDHCKIKSKLFSPVMTVILLTVSFMMAVIRDCTGVNVNIPLICALVPSFVLYLLLFDVKKLKLLYFFVSSVAVFSFGGLSTHYIEAILDMEMEIYIAYSIKWLVSLLFVIAEILFLKKLRWLLNNENVDTIWRFMWIVPIIITISNFLLIPLDEANVRAGRIFFMYLLFEAIMVVFFVVTLLMQYTIARAITNKVEAEQNSRLLGMQAAQYNNLKKYLDNTARVRHDFIYMANTARNLAAIGDIDNLKKLLNDYGESIDANAAPPVYCNNTAINAITAHYVSEAQKKNIRITVKLDISQGLHITDYEICSIVGNILDNAVSAAGELHNDDAEILFVAETKQNGDLYLAVSNSYKGMIVKKRGKFSSTKENGHGIGLESVRAVVQKNNGYCNFHYDEKKFYSEIMLRQD